MLIDLQKDIVISLCDKTGNMVKPWAEAGYTCYCVDIQHSPRKDAIREYPSGGKIIYTYGDARYWTPPPGSKIIFVASFPVCTNLAKSGAQDFSNAYGRVPKKGIPQLCDALMLFNACYFAAMWSGAPFCVENPSGVIPTHFRAADYTFHPWYYGDLYQKLTCLWTGNGFVMPETESVKKPKGVTQKIWTMAPGDDRQDKRSETPEGFARAVYSANSPIEKFRRWSMGVDFDHSALTPNNL
jgi:hypothetical protein